MSKTLTMILLILAMATVTYLIRALPLTFLRKKIKSRYINSVLYYMPYAVLSAMTLPFIIYATESIYSAIAGLVVAIISALKFRSLVLVSLFSCVAVFITELIISLIL